MNCSHTSSPGAQPGSERTQRGTLCFCHAVCFDCGRHLSASTVERVVASSSFTSAQLTTGALASRNGYPKIKSSGPISITKNTWVILVPRWLVIKSTASVIFPALFGVPSTFRTFRGVVNCRVASPIRATILGWMKHSVAPLSRSAFWSTLFFLVLSMNGT